MPMYYFHLQDDEYGAARVHAAGVARESPPTAQAFSSRTGRSGPCRCTMKSVRKCLARHAGFWKWQFGEIGAGPPVARFNIRYRT
jgi:hypothetical protein